MRIYIGNLSYEVTEDELRQEFGSFGEVASVSIPTDQYSGRPKGFAFVDMPSKSEAEAAVAALNGKMIRNRAVVVSEARPREEGGRGASKGFGRGRERRY